MKTMRLHQNHKIKLLVVDSNSKFIELKNYELSYTMFSVPNEKDVGDSSKNQNKAYLKVNYFVKNILNESIWYTLDEIEIMERFFSEYDNNFLVLPNITETTLLESLHSKLNVLAGDQTFIDQLAIVDTDTGVGYDLITDDDVEYSLPEQGQWMGELAFWEAPWWARYDTLTFDNYAESAEEIEKFNENTDIHKITNQALDDIDKDVDGLFNRLEGKTGEIIDLEEVKEEKWKPKIV